VSVSPPRGAGSALGEPGRSGAEVADEHAAVLSAKESMALAERKRPFYLVLAVLGALALGTIGASRGWDMVALYREPVDTSLAGRGIVDDGDRAAVIARNEALLRAVDAARPRGWPISVGELVLGSAILLFAMRVIGASRGSRAALVQLVVAQAALGALSYELLPEVETSKIRLALAVKAASDHQAFPQQERVEDLRVSAQVLQMMPRIDLALRTLCGTLVVLALTRRRAREFFDASSEVLGEG
jgi:hypothetical protein